MLKVANFQSSSHPQWLLEPHTLEGERQPQGIEVPPHSHIDGMFLLVQEGLVLLHGGREFASLPPGRIGWIPPGSQHEARWFGRPRGTALFVRAHACGNLPDSAHAWHGTPLTEALVMRLAQSSPEALNESHARSLFDVLVAELQLSTATGLSLPMPQDPRLLRLATTLLEAPDDVRGIEAWAQVLNMSERTLMRRFRAETGVTLGQWRVQARMLRALELLARGKPVTQVALAVGYESTSAFIGNFREQFGVTPSRYMAAANEPAATLPSAG